MYVLLNHRVFDSNVIEDSAKTLYQLTNQLITWNSPSSDPTIPQPVKKLSAWFGTSTFIIVFTRVCHVSLS